jgi:hypothetical protein
MEHPIDWLFQEWHQLGGAVLLAETQDSAMTRPAEEVIAESTTYCRESARLTWVVVDWLIRHVEQIDEQKLVQATRNNGDLSVLGVLCNLADLRKAHPKFKRIMAVCQPHRQLEPFFHRVARSPLALKLTQENGLEVFRKWNYLCRELRYL